MEQEQKINASTKSKIEMLKNFMGGLTVLMAYYHWLQKREANKGSAAYRKT